MNISSNVRWALLLLLVVVGMSFWWQNKYQHKTINVPTIKCQPQNGNCVVNFSTGKLTWLVKGDIQYLQPFEHSIELTNVSEQDIQSISIEFVMQGMQMAANRSMFKKQSIGAWKAQSVLPVCVSGRKDWLAVVKIESLHGVLQTGFQFSLEK